MVMDHESFGMSEDKSVSRLHFVSNNYNSNIPTLYKYNFIPNDTYN